MLWKCCTQYASKFGKLSSGHRTGKGQFSFQSKRKAMPKNVQTTAQLHSSHTLAKECSKLSKPGFSNTCTVNFQMYKLVLEKVEEPEIKLPTYAGSSKKQASSRKTSIPALLTMPKPLAMWITVNCGKFWKRWEYQRPGVLWFMGSQRDGHHWATELNWAEWLMLLRISFIGHLDAFAKCLLKYHL